MKIINELELEEFIVDHKMSKVNPDEISIKRVFDVWDGPLSGICQWKGEEMYFHSYGRGRASKTEDEERWPRKYFLMNLSDDKDAGSTEARSLNANQLMGWFEAFDPKIAPTLFALSYLEWKRSRNKES